MNTEFKIGDVVYLKSGSPAIVIYDISDGGYIQCYYWSKTNDRVVALPDYIHPEVLTKNDTNR